MPGGEQHPVYPGIEAAAANAGFTLAAGKGNDPDTLGKRLVYTYDSDKFPFYQAEVYHQYHNDFQSPPCKSVPLLLLFADTDRTAHPLSLCDSCHAHKKPALFLDGKAYNSLADLALEEGRIHITGCPDRV